MIGPAEIKERALRWWPEVLRAAVSGEVFFPRDIPRIGKVTSVKSPAEAERVRGEHEALRPGEGKWFVLAWREVDSRRFGRQRFVERIVVPDLERYLSLTGRGLEYGDFLGAIRLITTHNASLRSWLPDNVLEVLQYTGEWPYLLAVVDYFAALPERHRYYIRELPVAVPTKFIEGRKKVLTSLLEHLGLGLSAEERAERGVGLGVKDFERRYGLKTAQPLVRVRLLDRAMARVQWNGLTDLSLPLDDFCRLDLPGIRRVIVLENKASYSNLETFLTLPEMTGTAAVFGSGFAAGRLAGAGWLHDVELLYWGDLDAHGLQIVNQLRGHFPGLRTFLMDRATLEAHREYWVEATPSSAVALPHLTAEELALYDYLNDARVRLEQERISVGYVREVLRLLS